MRNIGLDVERPKGTCNDPECPFHGRLAIRGKILEGIVTSTKMSKTVTLERDYRQYVLKYMRYERRRSKILAHRPPCLDIKEGDKVRVAECRPLSKEVAFVVVEKLAASS